MFKYKGEKFILVKGDFKKIGGFRYKSKDDDCTIICINNSMPKWRQQNTFHKLIKKRKISYLNSALNNINVENNKRCV